MADGAQESEEDDEEERESKKEIEMKEDQVGSTQLEGGALYANQQMWMIGVSHILTRNLAFGLSYQYAIVPIAKQRNAFAIRERKAIQMRHDLTKEIQTKMLYGQKYSAPQNNANQQGT